MSSRIHPTDDEAEARLHELTRLLSAGVLRLRRQRLMAGILPESSLKTSAESTAKRLEVSEETVLSVGTS